MRYAVFIDLTVIDDDGKPIRVCEEARHHIITLSHEGAYHKLLEHVSGDALVNAGLDMHDCLVYDDEIDGGIAHD